MTPQDMTARFAMYTWHPVTINYTTIESSLFSNDRAVQLSEVRSAINAWYYENEPSELD